MNMNLRALNLVGNEMMKYIGQTWRIVIDGMLFINASSAAADDGGDDDDDDGDGQLEIAHPMGDISHELRKLLKLIHFMSLTTIKKLSIKMTLTAI